MNNGTFISPSPKEYSAYSDSEKIVETEQFYQKMVEVYSRIEKTEPEYTSRIDDLLESEAGWKTILEVLRESEAQLLCNYSYSFYVLELLCKIAGTEEQLNEDSVLKKKHCMKEISLWHQKIIFLLRRFEMDWELDEELLCLVQQKEVSYVLLAELICKEWISRKIHTGCRVFTYLYENGVRREALLFLMWLEQRLPYSERKIMHFSMVLLDVGEKKMAYEILLKHQSPDREMEDLINALGEVL